jgi:antitoxin ParD1/3/4
MLYGCPMTVALAAYQEKFVQRLVKTGRYNNASEVVRDALRKLEQADNSYLNPRPLPAGALAAAYREETKAERALHQAAARASVTPKEDE